MALFGAGSLVRSPAKNRSGWVPLAVVPAKATFPRTWISPVSLLLLLKSMPLDSCPPEKLALPCTVRTAGGSVMREPLSVTSRSPVREGASAIRRDRAVLVLATRTEPIVAEPWRMPLWTPSKTKVAAALIVPSRVRSRSKVCSSAARVTVDPVSKETLPFASKPTSVVRPPRTSRVLRKVTALVRRRSEFAPTSRLCTRAAEPPSDWAPVPLAMNCPEVGS